MRRYLWILAIALGLVTSILGTAACAAQPNYAQPGYNTTAYDDVPATPLMINGMPYCGWRYSQAECIGMPWPAAPFAFPTSPPLMSNLAAMAAWHYYLGLHSYYNGGMYYDRVLVRNHVTVVNRTTFVNSGSAFDKRYAADEGTYEKTATLKGKDGKTIPVTKLPKQAFSGGNSGSATSSGTSNIKQAPTQSPSSPVQPSQIKPAPTAPTRVATPPQPVQQQPKSSSPTKTKTKSGK